MITGRDEWKKLIPACCICRINVLFQGNLSSENSCKIYVWNGSMSVVLMPAGQS